MGGHGSGKRINTKRKAEQCLSINIRRLKKYGALHIGVAGELSWPKSRIDVQTLRFETFKDEIHFFDNSNTHNKFALPLTYTPCHYGGKRTWLVCPECSRRCGVMFLWRGYFRCRTCNEVGYESQYKDRYDRARRKRHKIESQLPLEKRFTKPKGMHWSTFNQRHNKLQAMESEVNRQLVLLVQKQWPNILDHMKF